MEGFMRSLLANSVIILSVVAFTALGCAIIVFSEADDAPGGVLLGMLLILGAVALGGRAVLRGR
jgi:hypothetical protein